MNSERAQNIEEYRAAKKAEMEAAQEASLQRFLDLAGRAHVDSAYTHPWKGGLSFARSGASRLAHTAGFIYGLSAQAATTPMEQLAQAQQNRDHPRDLAVLLAVSLNAQLRYLASYGGDRAIEVEAAAEGREAQHIKVPAFKVVLSDGGDIGGFTVMWYKPLTIAEVQTKARQIDEAAYTGVEKGTDLTPEESRLRWDAALETAKKVLNIDDTLGETRAWFPSWVQERKARYETAHLAEGHAASNIYSCTECRVDRYTLNASQEYIRYGFAFNGGLILHNLRQALQGKSDTPHWSVHT